MAFSGMALPPNSPASVLILGIGNYLVGDEGVGVHAVHELEKETWPAHVQVLDGGTGGFQLLDFFRTYSHIILIDATRDGAPAGTVRCFPARTPADFPPALGAHDIGLRDLLSAATLLGPLPRIDVITVSVTDLVPMKIELSPAVAAVLPEIARQVRALIG